MQATLNEALAATSLFWNQYWPHIATGLGVLDVVLLFFTIPWILHLKRDPMSAIAWCLLVILVPIGGFVLFLLFGYQFIHRPILRKQKQRRNFRQRYGPEGQPKHAAHDNTPNPDDTWEGMAQYALKLEAFPLYGNNKVTLYHEGQPAIDAMLEAIAAAKHHIHIETYILQSDELGKQFLAALALKAKEGVKVRLLYDGVGTLRMHWWTLREFHRMGGKSAVFLPISLLRRRFQVNMRNHRKIMVMDGKVGFTGGLNIGNEYVGKVAQYGFWRDTHLRVEGPAVESLQRVFIEDWDFAAKELVQGDEYFPKHKGPGDCPVQVIHSGPDQELKSIREIYFAAALRARKRLWIISPYYVPDQGLRDALCLAARSGVDVRLICPLQPDKWIPLLAARYYFTDLLTAGVKVYQYGKGFVHAKVWIADGQWASVGSANLDNRSLLLNFEANCMLYSPSIVAQLEAQFEKDCLDSIQLDLKVYARRPLAGKILENFCRLLSPIL